MNYNLHDDAYQGEIIEAVINDQWYDAKITKVIAPTQAEIDADKAEADDEVSHKFVPCRKGGGIREINCKC